MNRRYVYTATFLCLVLLVSGGIIFANGGDDHSDGDDHADSALVERGYEVFVANGCVACHGQNAEGSDIAPALAGHSEFAIRRQVRAPTNVMLVFGPDQISAEDLDALVAYIMNLSEEDAEHAHEHGHSGLAPGDVAFAHHWLVFLAIEAEDRDDALHHAAHIIPFIDGVHLPMIQELMGALATTDFTTARSIIEPMVTDVGDFSHDPATVYLQVALLALQADDSETAFHFVSDYPRHADDDSLHFAEDLLNHVEEGEHTEAVELITEHLGENTEFYSGAVQAESHDDGHDHNADAEHNEGEEQHDDVHADDAEHSDEEAHDDDHDHDADAEHSDDADHDDEHASDENSHND